MRLKQACWGAAFAIRVVQRTPGASGSGPVGADWLGVVQTPGSHSESFVQFSFGLFLACLALVGCFGRLKTLAGAVEGCFRGLFYEVSLALVGVASPA